MAIEVNLKNPLHAGDIAHKQRIYSGFESPVGHHQKSKTGYQWSQKRTDALQKERKGSSFSFDPIYNR